MPTLKPVFTACPECGKLKLPSHAIRSGVVACQNADCQVIVDLTHYTVIGRWKEGKEVYYKSADVPKLAEPLPHTIEGRGDTRYN